MSDLPQHSLAEQQDQPAWRRNSICGGRFAGRVAFHGFGGFAVAFTAYAVADMVPDGMWRAIAQVSVVIGVVSAVAVVMWARTRGAGRRRHPSTDSQVHNLSSWGLGKGLTRRFRRG